MKIKIFFIELVLLVFLGISTTEGEVWENQRNFLHQQILNLVNGKKSQGFHDIIMDEVHDIKMEFSKKVSPRASQAPKNATQKVDLQIFSLVKIRPRNNFCCHSVENCYFQILWKSRCHILVTFPSHLKKLRSKLRF